MIGHYRINATLLTPFIMILLKLLIPLVIQNSFTTVFLQFISAKSLLLPNLTIVIVVLTSTGGWNL